MKKTALHKLHKDLGAKMGEFAGYDMPLYYNEGVIKEHLWVRESCGLFDVSHMGQAMIKGPEGGSQALDFIHKLTPSCFDKLEIDRTKYTVLMNPEGGIIDDLMITCIGENAYHFVINAGCKDKDIAWIKEHLPEDLEFTHFDDWALLALQGPEAERVMLEALDLDLSSMPYMSLRAENDNSFFISRLGYTGEDGFELAVKNEEAQELAQKLLAHDAVKPIGLAARDSLRMEMGYALYGHEITAETSPVEAGLNWIIGKNAQSYFGYEQIHKHLSEGVERKLVGFKLTDKGVAREGAEIRNKNDKTVGKVTSGGYSPSLEESIGMAYVQSDLTQNGQEIFVNVRGRNIAAVVAPLPFMRAKTKSAKKKAA
ncbi:MAG: glycine cleavage system aminomethyltransferase GcvT [Pseudomonadota bacterium]